MATVKYSVSAYTADGTTTDYLITWDYLDDDHITVEVDGVSNDDPTANHTFVKLNDTTVRVTDGIGGAIAAGSQIQIRRNTPITTRPISFADGSALLASDLNKNSDYLLYAMQEALDEVDFTVQYQEEAEGFKDATEALRDETQVLRDATQVDTNAADAHRIAAALSETNAATSATNAATSETNAATSETNAATSETNAASSATAALASEGAAATSATNAATSETNAAASAAAAAGSEAGVAADAATATAEAAAAATSEANALIYKNNASTSATNAATSESNSASSASAAALSATNAAGSATAAGISEGNAQTYATNSQASAAAASTAELNAEASETAAATSATNAATSEANALSHANTAETAVQASQQFFDTYHIEATEPVGANVTTGDLWFDTTSEVLKVYNGSAWEAGVTAGSGFLPLTGGTMTGALDVQSTVTADGLTVDGSYSQSKASGTFFTLTDTTNSKTGYINWDSGNWDIFTHGPYKRLTIADNGDISFYEDTGTTAKFFWDASAESLGIGTSSPSTYGNLALYGNGTNKTLAIIEGSNSPANNDTYGSLAFGGRTDGTITAKISGLAGNNTNGTDGQLAFYTADNTAGSGTLAEAMRIDSSGNVGIGTSSPNNYSANHRSITLNAPTTPLVDLEVNGTRTGSFVANSTNVDLNAVTSVPIRFLTADTERMRIDSSGNLLVGKTSAGASSVGFEARANGFNAFTRDGSQPLEVRRLTSDGVLIDLRKDSSTVGSIGTANSGDLYIGNDDTTLLFAGGSDAILPRGTAGATRDGAVNLGLSSHRFKDGHFSGTVNAANFNTTSDATLKTNVETLTGSLDAVKAMRGVSYDWIENGNSEVGVIAQEVEEVIPDVVSTNDQGIKSVKYGNLVGVLIEAIKEQQAQIDELKAKLGE